MNEQAVWLNWVSQHWQNLTPGAKLEAPYWLPPPSDAGFESIEFAHPSGQIRDWGLSLSDNSRIHVHEYMDGRRIVHRDIHDPKRGLNYTLAHLMHETPYVKLAAGVVGIFLIARAWDG